MQQLVSVYLTSGQRLDIYCEDVDIERDDEGRLVNIEIISGSPSLEHLLMEHVAAVTIEDGMPDDEDEDASSDDVEDYIIRTLARGASSIKGVQYALNSVGQQLNATQTGQLMYGLMAQGRIRKVKNGKWQVVRTQRRA